MYTVTVPVMIRDGFDAQGTLAELLRARADRVLLALPRSMKRTEDGYRIDADAFMDKIATLIPFYRDAGLSVGVWLGETMGHGMGVGRGDYAYQPFVSITGRESNGGFCCSDERFRADVCRWAARAAEAGAELIVLDDDWRMNAHGDGIWPGCLCPDHLRRYCERVGEDLTIEEIADRVFTGGGSRYRDAWRSLMGDDLRRLAREIREAVDRVNPECRIGICAAPTAVGMDGADFMEIADALAGDNDPYVRLIGAPYWAKSGAELAGVVIGLQHQEVTAAELGFREVGDEAEVGGKADLVRVNRERVRHGGRVVRDGEGFDVDAAQVERGTGRDEDFVLRDLVRAFREFAERLREEVGGDAEAVRDDAARAGVVGVVVRDEDGAERTRVDLNAFEAAHQLFRGEPGVEQQIAFRSMDDRGIAFAAAAENGAAEGMGLSGSLLVHGGIILLPGSSSPRKQRRIKTRIL